MATGLAAELKESLGIDARLIPGKGGVFLVETEKGKVIYDKAETGRFPILGEVTAAIEASDALR